MENNKIYNRAIEIKNAILHMDIEGDGYNPLQLMKEFNLSEFQANKISYQLEGNYGRCKVVNNKLFILNNLGADDLSHDYRRELVRRSRIKDIILPPIMMISTECMMYLIEKYNM